jgi:hypothetical protein
MSTTGPGPFIALTLHYGVDYINWWLPRQYSNILGMRHLMA